MATSTTSRLRPLTLVLAAVAVLLVLTGALTLTAAVRHDRWESSCVATGGHVETVARRRDNPLIGETNDPLYECVDPGGTVRSRR